MWELISSDLFLTLLGILIGAVTSAWIGYNRGKHAYNTELLRSAIESAHKVYDTEKHEDSQTSGVMSLQIAFYHEYFKRLGKNRDPKTCFVETMKVMDELVPAYMDHALYKNNPRFIEFAKLYTNRGT